MKITNITEYFLGFQGEGSHQGKHSLFIRFGGCNLNCPFCDSKHSLNKTDSEVDINDILSKAKKTQNIVFTGGEPFLRLKEMITILNYLKSNLWMGGVEIETNGTITPQLNLLQDLISIKYPITVNVSPKNHILKTEKSEPVIFELLQLLGIPYIVKIVLTKPLDNELMTYVKKMKEIHHNVFLQPEGTTHTQISNYIKENYEKLIDSECDLSFRTHILIFDDEKGR